MRRILYSTKRYRKKNPNKYIWETEFEKMTSFMTHSTLFLLQSLAPTKYGEIYMNGDVGTGSILAENHEIAKGLGDILKSYKRQKKMSNLNVEF
jgi:hypothetical protein